MILINCPYCEQERAEIEFSYAGEAHLRRAENSDNMSDKEWETFLFLRRNPRGLHFERWYHIHGCARYFNAVRDTVSEEFVMTYKACEPQPSQKDIDEATS